MLGSWGADGTLDLVPLSPRIPLNEGEKLWVASHKVGVGILMNVWPFSTPSLAFPKTVVMKLSHKTQEGGGFEDVQQENLTLYQILTDNDSIAAAVPVDSGNFDVVDQFP